MSVLKFFDCNCCFGRKGIINPGSYYKAEDLVNRMEYYGIYKALVYHTMAREYSPAVGNDLLMEEIKPYSCLEPVWAVMPHHTGEFPPPDLLISKMRKNKVRAVTMFPSAADHDYSLAEWNSGELLSALEKNGILLIIGLEQFTSWNDIHDLCSRYRQLNIIITNLNYRVDRNLYPLLKKFDNLYIEISGYKVHQGIEEICRAFGANRMIYGSNSPLFTAAASICLLNYMFIELYVY